MKTPKPTNQKPPTLGKYRQQTTDRITEAFQAEHSTLVNSPPGLGKTYSTPRVAKRLEEPTTYLTERRDLYHQMQEECKQVGLSRYVLPSVTRDCSVFEDNGDHEQWQDEVWRLYKKGLSGWKIHEHFGDDLPCGGENCGYMDRLDFDPDDFDVLIGHYTHAYAEQYTENRTVVFDEFADGFVHEIENADRKISAYLKSARDVPYSDWSDLLVNRRAPEPRSVWERYSLEPRSKTILDEIDSGNGHYTRESKKLALAMLFMHDLGNGWESTRSFEGKITIPEGEGGGYYLVPREHPLQSLLPDDYRVARRTDSDTTTLWVRQAPDLSEARSIVALDGTPVRSMWNVATGLRFVEKRVVPRGEMNDYLQAMGTTVLQAGSGTKPYHSGKWTSPDLDGALMLGATVRFGEKPGVITTKKVLDQYVNIGDYADGTLNFGSVKSNNDFADKEVGVVLGTPHPGDNVLKRWGALMGYSIQDNGQKGLARSYGFIGDSLLQHFRENRVLQSILRFGRTPSSNATVILNHEAYPEWMDITEINGRNIQFRGSKKRQVVQTLRDANGLMSTQGIANATGVSRRRTSGIVAELLKEGYLMKLVDEYSWSPGLISQNGRPQKSNPP